MTLDVVIECTYRRGLDYPASVAGSHVDVIALDLIAVVAVIIVY